MPGIRRVATGFGVDEAAILGLVVSRSLILLAVFLRNPPCLPVYPSFLICSLR